MGAHREARMRNYLLHLCYTKSENAIRIETLLTRKERPDTLSRLPSFAMLFDDVAIAVVMRYVRILRIRIGQHLHIPGYR